MIQLNHYIAALTLSISVACIPNDVQAQEQGVKGRVLDLETFQPIAGVSVKVANQQLGTLTDVNGDFVLPLTSGAPSYTLVTSSVGYTSDSTVFELADKSWPVLTISLLNAHSLLDEVVITRRRERISEIALLDERRLSTLTVEKIGAQELSRKGVSDAASALTKLSGVSKTEGNNQVYVRGLGDRYNSTTLNGLPIVSNNPELKNIDLSLFTTDLVDNIGVDKVYNSTMSGDFAGGNVDISSKNYTGDGHISFEIGSNINSNVMGQWNSFVLQDGPRPMGFSKGGVPADPLSAYNFSHSLNPVQKTPITGSIGIHAGKRYNIGQQGRLHLFGTVNYGNDYNYREGVNRSAAAGGQYTKDLMQTRFGYRTNSTAMFNANYILNPQHKLSYNFVFINSSDQNRDIYQGMIRDLTDNGSGLLQRSTYAQHQLFIHQLLGSHQLHNRIDLDWGTSINTVNSSMPDRMQNISRFNEELGFRTLAQNQPSDNHRYYQDLTERELAAKVAAHYYLGDREDALGKISLGYQGRFKKRDFEDIQFNFRMFSQGLRQEVDDNNLDALINADNYNKLFAVEGFVQDFPQVYTGEQDIHAAFLQGEYTFFDKLTAVVGLRYERLMQSIYYQTNLDRSGTTNTFHRNGFLPNLNLRYALNDKQNLRLGASKTFTLPQFKERARFIYEDVTEIKIGNADLYPSQDYNLDLKWEMFPKASELLAVTAFGKYIKDPINEVTLASSTNDISFINTGDVGTVYGVELELKKDLYTFDDAGSKISVGGNSAWMKTNQKLSDEKVREETIYNINLTYAESSFTGASNFLANADLSYTKKWNNNQQLMATAVYSYFSDRIYALGSEGKGNQVDKGVHTVDFVLKYKINKQLGVDLSARNLLNPSYRRVQENSNAPVTILSYKKGNRFALSLKYDL